MRILIDIGHPGHVHIFRPFAQIMLRKGHEIIFTCRQKEFEMELLRSFGFTFITFGKHYNSTLGKVFGLLKFDIIMFIQLLKIKPTIVLSHSSMYAAHGAFLLGIPHISMEDTGSKFEVMLYKPFTKYILTPSNFPLLYGKKQISYNSYHEIAYLLHKYFNPNQNVYDYLNIDKEQKYAILRLVSWNAFHDLNKKGISEDIEKRIIDKLTNRGYKVFITSERKRNDSSKLLNIPPEMMHDALFFSDLVIGDSQTITAEAAVLGTPAIRYNSLVGTDHGYHHAELEEKYGLIYNFHPDRTDEMLNTLENIMNTNKEVWVEKKDKLLTEKIDATAFYVWFVENYPESVNLYKNGYYSPENFKIKSYEK